MFEITIGHAQALQRPVYGFPWFDVQSERTFKPQVKLYFLEPYNFELHSNESTPQLEGEITFRLMHESSETISRSDAERLARQNFTAPITADTPTNLKAKVEGVIAAKKGSVGGAYGRIWFEPETYPYAASGE